MENEFPSEGWETRILAASRLFKEWARQDVEEKRGRNLLLLAIQSNIDAARKGRRTIEPD